MSTCTQCGKRPAIYPRKQPLLCGKCWTVKYYCPECFDYLPSRPHDHITSKCRGNIPQFSSKCLNYHPDSYVQHSHREFPLIKPLHCQECWTSQCANCGDCVIREESLFYSHKRAWSVPMCNECSNEWIVEALIIYLPRVIGSIVYSILILN